MSTAPESAPGDGRLADSLRIAPDRLRWRCDPAGFDFQTTRDVEPIRGVVGQDAAVEALRFGLKTRAHGQNVFVRGLSGTGRMTLIRRLLEEIQLSCPLTSDRVYVHNFSDPARPRLLTLPRGQAQRFATAVDRLIDFIRDDLDPALRSEASASRMKALESATSARIKAIAHPLEELLARDNLALVTISAGRVTQPAIFPRVDGKPMAPEEYSALHAQGAVSDEDFQRTMEAIESHESDIDRLEEDVRGVMTRHFDESRRLLEGEVRSLLRPIVDGILAQFASEGVRPFLSELVRDLIENQLERLAQGEASLDHYAVNPILTHDSGQGCPIVIENAPSLSNLIGGIERRIVGGEVQMPDHMSIRKGSLLEADGGFLILEARDVISEPGAWRALVRTLRANRLEISPPEVAWAPGISLLKPDPITINVKVVLLGDHELFHALDALDDDFGHLFKVVAEFDAVIPRDADAMAQYAAVIRRIADEDDLADFSREAVAALVEHGARIASSRDKLTSRFSRIADIAREAAFLAREDGRDTVRGDDVVETVARTRRRADLSSRRFRELLADGTIHVDTTGAVIGQVNGLAVMQAGPLTYGFPARITASIGPGTAGVVNIEGESALSGAIHTKGFHILAGLLRNLLESDHPLSFEAALAFEQSYGGIDGDSASGAEMCCLMSALTRVPIRQDLAMTGAIDQLGNVQAIGGVNQKIEGFFDTCRDRGLSGEQGVIIPASNAGDLMLRTEVVEAAAAGRFHVYAVHHIGQAMELLMGRPLDDGTAASLISLARDRSREFWKMGARRPER